MQHLSAPLNRDRRPWIRAAQTAVSALVLLPELGLAEPSLGVPSAVPGVSGPDHIPQVVTALLVVIGFILAMAWLARRLLRITPRAVGAVRVLSGVSMGPREKLVLVQVGATQLLLGVAPGRIQTLHVLEEAIAPEALGTGLEARFADHVGRPPGALPGLAGSLARAFSGRARRHESASEKEPVQ